jgi:hypothetical protein
MTILSRVLGFIEKGSILAKIDLLPAMFPAVSGAWRANRQANRTPVWRTGRLANLYSSALFP